MQHSYAFHYQCWPQLCFYTYRVKQERCTKYSLIKMSHLMDFRLKLSKFYIMGMVMGYYNISVILDVLCSYSIFMLTNALIEQCSYNIGISYICKAI